MKDAIINYLKNNYSIELRAESTGFSANELKTYRDNFIKAVDRYFGKTEETSQRGRLLLNRVKETCNEIMSTCKTNISVKEIVDDASILIVWP